MLEPHHKPARGRLKVFLGYALGVWESISMLEEVQRRWGWGLDVVVGAVRPEISNWALVNNFEMMPPLLVEGVPVLDVPAVMNRRPTMCVVDGLAYDNPAGSRNAHRWQDADELLAAGINVIASVNLRYIDDQRHVVEKITGQKVDQTVPRTFVDMADEIVIVDPFEHELSALLALRSANQWSSTLVSSATAIWTRPLQKGSTTR